MKRLGNRLPVKHFNISFNTANKQLTDNRSELAPGIGMKAAKMKKAAKRIDKPIYKCYNFLGV